MQKNITTKPLNKNKMKLYTEEDRGSSNPFKYYNEIFGK